MNRYIDTEPTTDAELFDMLFGLFGIGDYVEDDERPWHRFRMVEISKIKALRKKRKISIDQLAVTARYCHRRRIHVTSSFGLTKHIGEALSERTLERRGDLDRRMSEAAREASEMGFTEWANRLLLAQGIYRQPLLAEWQLHRSEVTRDGAAPRVQAPL